MNGCGRKFDLQLLSQCGLTLNCPSRSVPEIHENVAGTLNNQQPTNNNPAYMCGSLCPADFSPMNTVPI